MGVEQSCSPEELPTELGVELGGVGNLLLTSVNVDFPLRPGKALVFFVNGKFVWVYAHLDPARNVVVGQWSASADEFDKQQIKEILRAENVDQEVRNHYLELNLNLNTAF